METIIGLVFALMIAVIVIVMMFPSILGAENAAGCTGMLRPIASLLANVAGVEIC